MSDSVTAATGWLQRRDLREADSWAAQDTDASRLHAYLRAEIARQLRCVVPHGWEVSAACRWQPNELQGSVQPDLMVHQASAGDSDELPAPPTLCVAIAGGPSEHRSVRPYAHLGVDHYWHLNSVAGQLEVLVRADDEYRRAELIDLDDTTDWIDFGVGIIHLAL